MGENYNYTLCSVSLSTMPGFFAAHWVTVFPISFYTDFLFFSLTSITSRGVVCLCVCVVFVAYVSGVYGMCCVYGMCGVYCMCDVYVWSVYVCGVYMYGVCDVCVGCVCVYCVHVWCVMCIWGMCYVCVGCVNVWGMCMCVVCVMFL